MPEGHSVHRLARQLQDVFGGTTVAISSPQGKFAAGASRLDGHVLERAEAHGKQVFLYFSHDLVMRVHLGLYGAWDFDGDSTFTGASSIGAPRRIGEREIVGNPQGAHASEGPAASLRAGGGRGDYFAGPPEPKGAVRVRLVWDHGWADLRGPTACEVITAAEAAVARRKLGPDPLNSGACDADVFVQRICKSATSIALQLMKQDVLAGVGNVYRAETLFRLGLDPLLPGKNLQREEAAGLWLDIARIMADGVRDGRIITTELADRPSGTGVEVGCRPGSDDGLPTRPNANVPVRDSHYVYKRDGLPCRHCGTEIAMKELGGRKLYWCPSCQRA